MQECYLLLRTPNPGVQAYVATAPTAPRAKRPAHRSETQHVLGDAADGQARAAVPPPTMRNLGQRFEEHDRAAFGGRAAKTRDVVLNTRAAATPGNLDRVHAELVPSAAAAGGQQPRQLVCWRGRQRRLREQLALDHAVNAGDLVFDGRLGPRVHSDGHDRLLAPHRPAHLHPTQFAISVQWIRSAVRSAVKSCKEVVLLQSARSL